MSVVDNFVNTSILFNPINWLIVVVVLLFVSFAAFTVFSHLDDLLPTGIPSPINASQ